MRGFTVYFKISRPIAFGLECEWNQPMVTTWDTEDPKSETVLNRHSEISIMFLWFYLAIGYAWLTKEGKEHGFWN